MPRPNMISGNYNYLGVGGHYKSGLAGLGNVSQAELDNVGVTAKEWQTLLANLNDDAAYGPGGYNRPGLMGPRGGGLSGFGDITLSATGLTEDEGRLMENLYSNNASAQQWLQGIQAAAFADTHSTYDPTAGYKSSYGAGGVTEWFMENWQLLVGGGLLAMIVLPHLAEPQRRR